MSTDLHRVLRRVQTDFGFYNRLSVDPESALSGFDLTAVERAALTGSRRTLHRYLVPGGTTAPDPRVAEVEEESPPEPEPEPEPDPGSLDLTLPTQFTPPGPLDPPLGPPAPDLGPPDMTPPPGMEPPDLSNFVPPLVPEPPEIFKAPPIPINFLSGLAGLLPYGPEPSHAAQEAARSVREVEPAERKPVLIHLLKILDGRERGEHV